MNSSRALEWVVTLCLKNQVFLGQLHLFEDFHENPLYMIKAFLVNWFVIIIIIIL